MFDGILAVAGETNAGRPFSMKTDPGFLALIKIMQEADVTYAHEETIMHDFKGFNIRPFELFMNPMTDPKMAAEWKWAGIDMVSCASNHSGEWGEEGIRENIEALNKAGISPAGTGMNLQEAGAPAYYESNAGRVALISMASGSHPYDVAGLSMPPVRGRPGLNGLRITMKYILDQKHADMLKEVWQSLDLMKAMRGQQIRKYVDMNEEEGDFYLDFEHVFESQIEGFYFGIGDKPQIVAIPNQWDIERNLRMVKEAKTQADLVLVAHHNQSAEGLRDWDKPSSFIPPFAKACIDAGADAYIGHGWHRELGIEIYKDKPLFYSMGNFIGGGYKRWLPADTYEGVGLDLNLLSTYTPEDARYAARGDRVLGFFDDPDAKEVPPTRIGGILNKLKWDKGELTEMELYPYEYVRSRGLAYLASGKNAQKLLEYKKKLSAPYGTSIEIKDDIGVIKIK